MVDLKCKCGKCEYNNNCNCYAKHIVIDRSTKCQTFSPSSDDSKAEFSDEIPQPLIRTSIEVLCNATCLFNKQGKCLANGITVLNENSSVECSTFLEK